MLNRQDYQLRLMNESDLELVLDWRNSDRIRFNMYTDHIISLEEHKAWFSGIKNDESMSYHICEYNQKPIGVIYFTSIDQQNQKCYWGFYLGDVNAVMGSGSIMEFLALEYVFDSLDIRKLCAEIFVFNDKVIKLHKKFGFQQESYFVKHILKGDKYEDVIGLALFKNDWLNIKENLYNLVFRIKNK